MLRPCRPVFAAAALALVSLLPACAEKLIPAGSVVQCTVSEGKISSKTYNVGDPVLCRLSPMEYYGRSTFPYGSYLIGRFEAYKDPGHLVGKGWMELKFDRLVVAQTDEIIPISAKVVEVPNSKYPVDKEGRIHGTGHPVRDTVEWLIPVLWPIDLINLPRRGPYPTLKPETKLTLRLMDDFGIPTKDEIRQQVAEDKYPQLLQRQAPVERQAPVQYVQPQAPPQTVIYNYQPPQQQQPQYVQGPTQYVPGPTQYVPVPVRVPAYPPPYPPRIYASQYYGGY